MFDKLSDALKFDDADSCHKNRHRLRRVNPERRSRQFADYFERSFTMEAEYPGLETAGASTPYRYGLGNFCNSVGFSLPLNDSATASFAFLGTDYR